MRVGCVKEIKKHEYRVGMTPDNVVSYTVHGHQVAIETKAGIGAGFSDENYHQGGTQITDGIMDWWLLV